MAGKMFPFTYQIRSYIKNRFILGIQAKDIFNEICRVYGNNELSFSSVTRWCKKFKSGVDSVKDAPRASRPKTATSPKIVEKVKDLIATDARFTTRHIAKFVGISVGSARTILRHDLQMRRISARWIPLLLTKEQTLARVRIAKQFLKQLPKYNNRSFGNIISGDETWVHFYEPSERYRTKYGQPKEAKDLA
ncbi:protein GVQW3-like [Mercenaria mercenaria]|uniref:protein GVQW3-like n=1 Tax=Mercenaria mercenaria TaxID=6596 RepID=UPI00234F6115|nr:protein GVQW3-like [Mercenaria mercenaria]